MIKHKIGLALVVFIFASVPSVRLTSHAQSSKDHVVVIVGHQLGDSNTFLADAQGFFAAQNIEIEFVDVSSTNDANALALLLKGDVDVVQAGPTPAIFNTIARGEHIKAVATSYTGDPDSCAYSGFVVASGKAANFSAADLKGAHLAVPNGGAQYYLDKLLQKYNLTASDVIIDNIPSSARAEALANGSVVMAWMNEPLLSQSIQKLKFESLASANKLAPGTSVGVVLFGPKMLDRKDDLAVRYLTAYLQGIQQFQQGPTPDNLAVVAKALKIDQDSLTSGCWIKMNEHGEINTQATFVDLQNWYNDQKQLDKVVKVEDIYDPSYVQQAYARLQAMMATPAATSESGK